MKKRFTKTEYFLAAVLALVAAFPLAVENPAAMFETPLEGSVTTTSIRQKALDNYANYRDTRRDYQDAVALCEKLQSQGVDVTCPDVNDIGAVQYFLATHKNLATSTGSTMLIIQSPADLSSHDQNLLKWYMKINTCPTSLQDYLPGFYKLCQSMLDRTPTLYRGITGPSGSVTNQDVQFDDYVKANKGVKRTW